MGKYREAYTKFIEDTEQDRIEGNNHLDPLVVSLNILENAEDEIAQLQSEKSELESRLLQFFNASDEPAMIRELYTKIANLDEESKALKSKVDELLSWIRLDDDEDILSKYNALVERVKAHNTYCTYMCENRSIDCNKKNGYPNVRCLDCAKENLIDLDTKKD